MIKNNIKNNHLLIIYLLINLELIRIILIIFRILRCKWTVKDKIKIKIILNYNNNMIYRNKDKKIKRKRKRDNKIVYNLH
jgi:hypothetical protein